MATSDLLKIRKTSVVAAANSTLTGKVLHTAQSTTAAVVATKLVAPVVTTVAASTSVTVNPTTKTTVAAITTKSTKKY